jgi:hypothetical protein
LVLDVKLEENKETPNLLSLQIRFVCGIYQQIPQISPKFGRILIFWNFIRKTIPPIYRNGGSNIIADKDKLTSQSAKLLLSALIFST